MSFVNALTLDTMGQSTDHLPEVKKKDLRGGDLFVIKTRNSVYRIRVRGEGHYEVSGGWFTNKGLDGSCTTINGCTWGGSVIKTDIVAACGLCLEFGNRVTTSAIQKIFVFERSIGN